MFIYITYDTDGFITAYQNTEEDGFTKVFVLDSWIPKFAQHSDKFRYDTDKKVVLNPGNLPELSLDELNEGIKTLTSENKQLKQFSLNGNMAQVSLTQQLEKSNSTIEQLKKLSSNLSQQLVLLMSKLNSPADTTKDAKTQEVA